MSDQQDDHARLLARIHAHADRGHMIPCHGSDGHKWIEDNAPSRQHAVDHCQQCPALDACAEYALTHKEKSGVWGAMTPAHRLDTTQARKTPGKEKSRATHRP